MPVGVVMDAPRHSLLLPFDTDEPEFARGFELGRLWATLRTNPAEEIEELVHSNNAEMALRMAEALERDVSSLEVDETWMKLQFGPAESRSWANV